MRDSAYALTALLRFGLREETHGAISWLLTTARAGGAEPSVVYTVDGERPPDADRARRARVARHRPRPVGQPGA